MIVAPPLLVAEVVAAVVVASFSGSGKVPLIAACRLPITFS